MHWITKQSIFSSKWWVQRINIGSWDRHWKWISDFWYDLVVFSFRGSILHDFFLGALESEYIYFVVSKESSPKGIDNWVKEVIILTNLHLSLAYKNGTTDGYSFSSFKGGWWCHSPRLGIQKKKARQFWICWVSWVEGKGNKNMVT